MNALRSVSTAAVVLFMALQAQRVWAVEGQGGTVSGGKHLSVTFTGAGKPYGITTTAASGWEFRDATHISNTLNWYPDPGHNNHNRWGKTRDDSSDNNNELFSVRIWGKIVPVGTGSGEGPPPPTDWSVKGKMDGDYEINPEKLVLHVSETGSFMATMGSQQVNSNWEFLALDGSWRIRFDSGTPVVNIGRDGDFTFPEAGVNRYLVTGRDASDENQCDTAALVIYKVNMKDNLLKDNQGKTLILSTRLDHAWSGITSSDSEGIIEFSVIPTGESTEGDFGYLIDAADDPSHDDKGHIAPDSWGNNDHKVRYLTPIERLSDLRPIGRPDVDYAFFRIGAFIGSARSKNDFISVNHESTAVAVYSTFKYTSDYNGDKEKAIDFVLWKYSFWDLAPIGGRSNLSYESAGSGRGKVTPDFFGLMEGELT